MNSGFVCDTRCALRACEKTDTVCARRVRYRTQMACVMGAILLGLAATAFSRDAGLDAATRGAKRRLLSSSDTCKAKEGWELPAGILAYFVGVVYLFIGIAIVCDEFFVASLEAICEALGLSDDVAGATFMAAGSSAPELASSAMSLINSGTDNAIGVGTIVGSAVFNILVIIGTTVIFDGQTLEMDWKPMARDCTFYAAAICGIVATFHDGRVDLWEGLIYVLLYGSYIAFMWKNEYFLKVLDDKFGDYFGRPDPAVEMEEAAGDGGKSAGGWGSSKKVKVKDGGGKPDLSITGAIYVGLASARFKSVLARGGTMPALSRGQIRAIRADTEKVDSHWVARKASDANVTNEDESSETDGDAGGENPFKMPESWSERPMWALCVPWYAFFTITIPPCQQPKWQKWYFASFATSIGWIGLISHFMVEWCARIGCLLGIPAVVMGTTVLAAGTSIPDALSSIAVAKEGLANMAVANAVGSNVFDIWLGLGLPWLLYLSWQSPSYILVDTAELVPSSFILLGVLVVYISTVAMNGFRMTRKMGICYILLYGVYALYNIILVWVLDIYGIG